MEIMSCEMTEIDPKYEKSIRTKEKMSCEMIEIDPKIFGDMAASVFYFFEKKNAGGEAWPSS